MFYLHAIIIPFQKHTDKMANSVDHDQTAPLIRVHTARPDLCLKNLDHCDNKISMFYLYAIIIPSPHLFFFFFLAKQQKGFGFYVFILINAISLVNALSPFIRKRLRYYHKICFNPCNTPKPSSYNLVRIQHNPTLGETQSRV